jgi:peptidyl-tRNA hydrolase, PTH1 family
VRVIFGIGNPGSGYQYNRHNAGFLFLDQFAEDHNLVFKTSKADYYYASGEIKGLEYILIKPSTFVNRSGVAAEQIINETKLELNDFLVLSDDVNLETGEFRFRTSGGDGGHNGLKSIIYYLGSESFPRLRFGIGNSPEDQNLAGYVLENFTNSELKKLNLSFKNISLLVEEFIVGGIKSMLDLNSRLNNSQTENDFKNIN